MNFAGIAVLTEPDASRASYNWVHYVHRGSRRHASAGKYRNLSSARYRPSSPREVAPPFFPAVRAVPEVARYARARARARDPVRPASCSSSCRLIDDASFYTTSLNPSSRAAILPRLLLFLFLSSLTSVRLPDVTDPGLDSRPRRDGKRGTDDNSVAALWHF